jgi:hypothetical protein
MTVRAGTLPAICLLLVDAHAPPMHAQDTRSDTVVWTGIILEGIPHNIYTWRFERRRGTYEEDGSSPLNGNVFQKPRREYSEETAREIDVAVRQIVDAVWERTRAILVRERAQLERWAQKLLEKETLTEDELAPLWRALQPERALKNA